MTTGLVATISEVLGVVQPESVFGLVPAEIDKIACHPAGIEGSNCLFVCINEYLEYNKWQTWRTYLETLPQSGVAAVVTPEKITGLDVPQLITAHPRRALGELSRLLNGYPDLFTKVIGITGTNGKTTTTRLLAHLLNRLGTSCGSIGTLGIELAGRFADEGTYTTPLAPQLYHQMRRMRDEGAAAIAMEVSSHGLSLERVAGVAFDAAILTNVERDHLDFHGTLDAYAEAKRQLFTRVRRSGNCILNKNSPYCESFAQSASARVFTYGHEGTGADLELTESILNPAESLFKVRYRGTTHLFRTHLVGGFQVENAMAAIALLLAMEFECEAIAHALEDFPSVCGRMERFSLKNGATAIVDYAHNPDGLKNVLESCRHLCRGRLHIVVGCGGDRDRGKRPIMGNLASSMADVCWITSDNPRTEDPQKIIEEILAGCKGANSVVNPEPDRKSAIINACRNAEPDDLVVIAGKGHEDYQLIGYTKYPFSDQSVLKELGAG